LGKRETRSVLPRGGAVMSPADAEKEGPVIDLAASISE